MSMWNPSEWQYRGEGNKHLVLFYNGCSIELVRSSKQLRNTCPHYHLTYCSFHLHRKAK
jgi:hypothetical protein